MIDSNCVCFLLKTFPYHTDKSELRDGQATYNRQRLRQDQDKDKMLTKMDDDDFGWVSGVIVGRVGDGWNVRNKASEG